MFKQTSLPVARSIHYQLIDIQLDEVQQMVHSNDGEVSEREREGEKKPFIFLLLFSSHIYIGVCLMTGALFVKHTCELLIREILTRFSLKFRRNPCFFFFFPCQVNLTERGVFKSNVNELFFFSFSS